MSMGMLRRGTSRVFQTDRVSARDRTDETVVRGLELAVRDRDVWLVWSV